jgi:oxaloacetate decarboxylase alpha subunit
MAGLLHPYDAYDLVKKLKAPVDIPIQLHAHATTGLSTASIVKAVEAGIVLA